jgi:fatty acid desaturase
MQIEYVKRLQDEIHEQGSIGYILRVSRYRRGIKNKEGADEMEDLDAVFGGMVVMWVVALAAVIFYWAVVLCAAIALGIIFTVFVFIYSAIENSKPAIPKSYLKELSDQALPVHNALARPADGISDTKNKEHVSSCHI